MDTKPDPVAPLSADELAEDLKDSPHEADAPPLTEAAEGSSPRGDAVDVDDPAETDNDGEALIERGLTRLPPG